MNVSWVVEPCNLVYISCNVVSYCTKVCKVIFGLNLSKSHIELLRTNIIFVSIFSEYTPKLNLSDTGFNIFF